MIISQIKAGLGNQMFQYAAARNLSLKHKTELKLDTLDFERDHFRKYGLDSFNITATIANSHDIFNISKRDGVRCFVYKKFGRNAEALVDSVFTKLNFPSYYATRYYDYNPQLPTQPPLLIGNIASQRFFHFDAEVLTLPDNIIMAGTWISERYFLIIRKTLLKEFCVKHPLTGKNLDLSKKIRSTNSIAIHLRRTDKVNNPYHKASGISFCKKATQHILAKVKDAHFYIFSDDIAWAKKNITFLNNANFVDHNDDLHNYEDLRLMKQCKHQIIA